jgi:hypothetical protein
MNGYDWEKCQGYMKHMDQEHARLNQELRRLHDEVQCAAPRASILTDLEMLRRDLAAHFQEEEGEGCLEEAVSRCPSLAHEVRAIEGEHRELLGQVDAMIASEKRPGGLSAEEVGRFAAAIDRHEAAEDHVVQHGFNVAADV